jgi:hypothetical protein
MRSARDFAPTFLTTRPRCTFHVGFASPVFAATCLFINPDVTRAITSRSRGLRVSKQSAYPGCRLSAFPTYAITLDADRDGVQHVLLAEWFRQEIDRARLHRSRRHGNIGVSSHDGDIDIRAGEFGLKIEAAHARPPDVEHQTARGSGSLLAKNSVSEPNTSACRQRPLGRGSKFVNTRYCRTRNSPGTPGLRLRSV